jgi:conjugative transposon TraN protein
MKKYFTYTIAMIASVFYSLNTQAQQDSLRPRNVVGKNNNSFFSIPFSKHNIKGSYHITAAYFKTTHIVFDSKIAYFDIGSKNVIGEKAEGIDNVLKIKAAFMEAFETNVTVITGNGKYYSFLVSHDESPAKLNIIMDPITIDYSKGAEGKILFMDNGMNETTFKSLSAIALKENNIKHIRSSVGGVKMGIQNILSKDNYILITLKMKNKSSLNYDVELLKAYIRDKETSKRDLTQEVEVKPVYAYIADDSLNKKKVGEPKGEYGIVLLFNKFAIAKNKTFDIDIVEKNGGRNFNLKIDFESFYYQMKQL